MQVTLPDAVTRVSATGPLKTADPASQNAPSGATEIGPDGPLHGVTWRQLAPSSVVSQTPEIGTKASHASPETAKPWMGSAPPFGWVRSTPGGTGSGLKSAAQAAGSARRTAATRTAARRVTC